MPQSISDRPIQVNCDARDYSLLKDLEKRKLYLSGGFDAIEDREKNCNQCLSGPSYIIKQILDFNEQDKGLAPEERIPIRLFINSPGGSTCEGSPLVSAIELSKTPVYTINIGLWGSMAFLVGISGHRRFALPYTEFLMHEGSLFTAGSAGSVQDVVDFNKRYTEEVIKKHVLKHSKMSSKEYDASSRRENYMLPEDALRYGFIDEIISDIDTIL